MSSQDDAITLGAVRTFILAILVMGLIGTAAELLLLDHDEGVGQLVPLVAIVLGLSVIGWHAVSRTLWSVRMMRVVMAGFIVSGALGVVLHYNGSAEFQKEIQPSMHGTELFKKVMQSKAPPVLAPGVMAQLGLLGLAFTFRHPSRR